MPNSAIPNLAANIRWDLWNLLLLMRLCLLQRHLAQEAEAHRLSMTYLAAEVSKLMLVAYNTILRNM